MTGDVPYYGGRLTPGQTYALTHQARPPHPPPGSVPMDKSEAFRALQYLLDTGVISPSEHTEFMGRVTK